MKKKILGLLVLMLTFVSCIDQEKIDIAYQADMSITAKHLFDSYTAIVGDEFNMQGNETTGTWNLNLHALIYDGKGQLVKNIGEQFSDLNGTLNFDLDLLPGNYAVVAIAEFTGTYAGEDHKYWYISNEENLRDLTIKEGDNILNSPFETLGIASKEFEIGDCIEKVAIDILPVTGLLQTVMWEEDMSGNGFDGYSFYSPFIKDLTIWASELKQVVKFNGSVTPLYDFDVQGKSYPIAMSFPEKNYEENRTQHLVSYRALLPQEGRDFYWTLNCVQGCGEYLFPDKKDYQISEMTDNKLTIESGKQYAMDLLLDALYLYVQDYDKDVEMYDRAKEIQRIINLKFIRDLLEERYDRYVGKNKATIDTYLYQDSYMVDNNRAYYFFEEGIRQGLVAQFTDNTLEKAQRIMLVLNIATDEGFDLVAEALAEIYTPYDAGTTGNIKQFINAETVSDATVGIAWDAYNKCLYFDAI